MIHRRELLQRTSILLGGSLLGADSLLAKHIDWDAIDAAPDDAGIGLFTKQQIRLLNEIADTIIPTTDTPGAKAAKVGQFIAVYVSDCLEAEEQTTFLGGLAALDARCKKDLGKSFRKCSAVQRRDYLTTLDREWKTGNHNDASFFFTRMKELTLWGYFTSETGCTQAQRMVEIPGRYEGCVPYAKGERAWGGY